MNGHEQRCNGIPRAPLDLAWCYRQRGRAFVFGVKKVPTVHPSLAHNHSCATPSFPFLAACQLPLPRSIPNAQSQASIPHPFAFCPHPRRMDELARAIWPWLEKPLKAGSQSKHSNRLDTGHYRATSAAGVRKWQLCEAQHT